MFADADGDRHRDAFGRKRHHGFARSTQEGGDADRGDDGYQGTHDEAAGQGNPEFRQTQALFIKRYGKRHRRRSQEEVDVLPSLHVGRVVRVGREQRRDDDDDRGEKRREDGFEAALFIKPHPEGIGNERHRQPQRRLRAEIFPDRGEGIDEKEPSLHQGFHGLSLNVHEFHHPTDGECGGGHREDGRNHD